MAATKGAGTKPAKSTELDRRDLFGRAAAAVPEFQHLIDAIDQMAKEHWENQGSAPDWGIAFFELSSCRGCVYAAQTLLSYAKNYGWPKAGLSALVRPQSLVEMAEQKRIDRIRGNG